MHIQRFFKFVREEFGFLLLLKKLLFEKIDFSLEIWDALSLGLGIDQLSLERGNLVNVLLDLCLLLVVVDVTLVESTLLDFDLFIEVVKLFISLDELG